MNVETPAPYLEGSGVSPPRQDWHEDADRETRIITSELSRTLIGVEAGSVVRVVSSSPGGDAGDTVDVAVALRLPDAPGGDHRPTMANRRVLVVAAQGGLCRLLVGESTQLATVDAADVHDLPSFLASPCLDLVSGIFAVDGRLGFLVDASALPGRREGEETR